MNCCKIGLTLLISISDIRHGKLNCTVYAAAPLLVTVKTFSAELVFDVFKAVSQS